MRIQSAVRILCAGILIMTSSAAAQSGKKFINLPSEGRKLPFSDAVLVGDTLYLSGHIGLDKDDKVPGTAEAEARLVLQQLEATLKAAGMGLQDLVYVQVFCSDVAHFSAWNKVYREVMKEPYPARAFIGSGKLLYEARFEVLGIAVKKK
jgi:2-iminobutanoate/2-iminopropanoate deaminase